MSPGDRTSARVAVAVSPRLLADGLTALLAGHGLEVVAVTPSTTEHFAVAVTTSLDPTLSTDLVVVLEDGPAGTAAATARAPSGGPLVRLQGLSAIVDFILGWAAHSLDVAEPQR